MSPLLSFCSSRRGFAVVLTALLLVGAPELAPADEGADHGVLPTIA